MTSIFLQGVTSHLGKWFGCFPMVFSSSLCNKHNSGKENQQEVFYWRQLSFMSQESWKTWSECWICWGLFKAFQGLVWDLVFGLQESEIDSVAVCFKLEAPGIGTNPKILERHTTAWNVVLNRILTKKIDFTPMIWNFYLDLPLH